MEAKPKKPMSEKQKANLKKGLAILKAKREAKKKDIVSIEIDDEPPKQSTEVAEPVSAPTVSAPEPAPAPKHHKEPAPKEPALPHLPQKYLTKEDLHEFKNDLLATLYPPQTPVEEAKIRKPRKKTIAQVDDDQDYAPTAKKEVSFANKPNKALLSGYALLDALLNR